jgi:hypothetical protein
VTPDVVAVENYILKSQYPPKMTVVFVVPTPSVKVAKRTLLVLVIPVAVIRVCVPKFGVSLKVPVCGYVPPAPSINKTNPPEVPGVPCGPVGPVTVDAAPV